MLIIVDYFFSKTAPGFAGIIAPAVGAFLLLKSSESCSMVTNFTPSCFLKCSRSLVKF